jgi:pyruvate/2-oxoglutarate dehydrogenase complex dihydrolipoamide acyltransferase (E2) component
MAKKVLMPQLGEAVLEGTLTRWLKAAGETVKEYEPLVELNTDKVDTEIPSPATGVLLQILVPAGATVQVGQLLAWIGEPGEVLNSTNEEPTTPSTIQADQTTSQMAPPSAVSGRDKELGFISPVVARMAGEHGIDLYQITGTGQGGRITKKDLERYLEQRATAITTQNRAAGTQTAPVSALPADRTGGSLRMKPGNLVSLTPLRKQIAEHMVRSRHTSAHVTTIMEADLGRVIDHRLANKERFSLDGVNLTLTAYFVAASVAALKAYPLINSSWTDDGILIHPMINIGVATSLGEAGLIVPVIKNADSLSLLGIARTVNDLANRARNRQLSPDEVQGGTFTITNHGVSKSLFATPIINQPQCAILGVGAVQKRPVVVSDERLGDVIAIRSMVYLGLTFDHRILDGVLADFFLGKLVETLEGWS